MLLVIREEVKKGGGIVVRNGGSNFQKLLSQVEEGPVKLGFGAHLK